MKAWFTRGAAALAVGAVSLCWNTVAKADNVVVQPAQQPAQPAPAATTTTTAAPVVVQPTTAPVAERAHDEYVGPNRALLTGGLFTFGIPYVTSVVIAAESPHNGDGNLYVPVAGPFIDLAQRPSCPSSQSGCDSETANKVLLGIDGVVQTIGALEIIGAFVFPETREATTIPATAYTPAMHLTPAKMGKNGYGMTAFAEF